jgi:hypothetical protein
MSDDAWKGVPRAPAGSDAGGQWVKGKSKLQEARDSGGDDRVARALATYKPSTKAKQDIADQGEAKVRKMLGGTRTGDNLAMDVLVDGPRGSLHGVEVKTVIDNGNNKITMHPSSRRRKEEWAQENRARIHTVVVDSRSGTVWYREGVGAFRLHTLTKVQNAKHLRQLMGLE